MDQFVGVTTTGAPEFRVDGYEQSIGDGTPLATAKAAVLALLPRDTKTASLRIAHAADGGSCALWNLKSRTLGRWLGAKTRDRQGRIDVELSTVTSSGMMAFERGNVSDAILIIGSASKTDGC